MTAPELIKRGDVVRLRRRHPVGTEIKKDRPWVVLSPNEINAAAGALIVAPLTKGVHPYMFRVPCTFAGEVSHIVLDQLLTVHHRRVYRRIGALSPQALRHALAALREMFEE